MISILVIDDHPLVTGGIKAMLQTDDGIVVSGSAKSAAAALELLQRDVYDIILLDISLPDMDGLKLCQEIRKISNEVKIIGLTSSNETGIITQLLQRGGNGYLLKNMERQELLTAIEKVMDGKIYLCEAANEKILEQYKNVKAAVQSVPVLTRRELEILQLLNDGLTGPQIAQKLFLSPYTVETHRKNLMQKFSAGTSQMLLKMARQHRMIQ